MTVTDAPPTIPVVTRPTVTLAVAGTVVVATVGYLSVRGGAPSPLSPFSLAIGLPALAVSAIGSPSIPMSLLIIIATFPTTVAFVAWFWSLGGEVGIPVRSMKLFGVCAALSALILASSASAGVRHQGVVHTLAVFGWNAVLIPILFVLAVWSQRKPGQTLTFAFHLLLFSWIAWCAFPWLGELL